MFMVRGAGDTDPAEGATMGWTIVHHPDRAMDLYLSLLAQRADEALRPFRATDERAAHRHKHLC